MKYYECENYDPWKCPDSCEGCPDELLFPTKEGELILRFLDDLEGFKSILAIRKKWEKELVRK